MRPRGASSEGNSGRPLLRTSRAAPCRPPVDFLVEYTPRPLSRHDHQAQRRLGSEDETFDAEGVVAEGSGPWRDAQRSSKAPSLKEGAPPARRHLPLGMRLRARCYLDLGGGIQANDTSQTVLSIPADPVVLDTWLLVSEDVHAEHASKTPNTRKREDINERPCSKVPARVVIACCSTPAFEAGMCQGVGMHWCC